MSIPQQRKQALTFARSILEPYIPDITENKLAALAEPPDKNAPAIEQRYKIKEVASMLHCSVKHVWNLVKKGELSPERGAGITRIKESEIKRLLNK